MQPHSLYLHFPFCKHRCAYCDFNTYAGLEHMVPDYIAALCQEIELLDLVAENRIPVHTIFFGGGTPSLLSAAQIEQVHLDGANFRRSVLAEDGWVIPTGRRARPGSTGGKPAELYRAGRMWKNGSPVRYPQSDDRKKGKV